MAARFVHMRENGRPQELCACQVIEVLGLAPSTVSKHMTILRQAGPVQARKEWWWRHYSLPQSGVRKPVKESIPCGVVLEKQHQLYPVAYEKNGLSDIAKLYATGSVFTEHKWLIETTGFYLATI